MASVSLANPRGVPGQLLLQMVREGTASGLSSTDLVQVLGCRRRRSAPLPCAQWG
jgi:hypothetical protein